MNSQKKINKIDAIYNQIILEEFSTNSQFIDYASNFAAEKSNVKKGFLPTTLRPRFNTKHQDILMKKATEIIMSGLTKIENALKNGDKKLQKFIGLSDDEVQALHYPRKYKNHYPFVRFDATLENDEFKVIEINLNFPGGPGVIDSLSGAFSKLSSIKKIANLVDMDIVQGYDESLFRLLLKYYLESGYRDKKPNILILRWSDYEAKFDSDSLAKYFSQNGCRTIVVDPRSVEYSNGYLHHRRFKARLILKWFDMDILLKRKKQCGDLINALSDGHIVMINPLSAAVMASKTIFGVMTDKKFNYLFSPTERLVFKKTIPWTRTFSDRISDVPSGTRSNLLRYAIDKKDEIILKPSVGTCGYGVYIGVDYTVNQWQKLIKKIIIKKNDYIIQERVKLLEGVFPAVRDNKLIFEKKKIDVLPMMYDGKYFGSFSRCASGHILNGYRGGIVSLNYVIKNSKK